MTEYNVTADLVRSKIIEVSDATNTTTITPTSVIVGNVAIDTAKINAWTAASTGGFTGPVTVTGSGQEKTVVSSSGITTTNASGAQTSRLSHNGLLLGSSIITESTINTWNNMVAGGGGVIHDYTQPLTVTGTGTEFTSLGPASISITDATNDTATITPTEITLGAQTITPAKIESWDSSPIEYNTANNVLTKGPYDNIKHKDDSVYIDLADAVSTYGKEISIGLGNTTSTITSKYHKIAVGNSNTASNNFSSAFGYNNTASGSSSTAVGNSNTASGSSSTAVGNSNTASGANISSSAVGNSNTASGNSSSAFGHSNTASGNSSSAFGYSNTASNNYSSAFGYSNTASTNYSSAFGYNNKIYSHGGHAYGRNNTVGTDGLPYNAENSIVIGVASTTTGLNSIVIGKDYTNSTGNVIVLGGTTQKPVLPYLNELVSTVANNTDHDSVVVLNGQLAKTNRYDFGKPITVEGQTLTGALITSIGSGGGSSGPIYYDSANRVLSNTLYDITKHAKESIYIDFAYSFNDTPCNVVTFGIANTTPIDKKDMVAIGLVNDVYETGSIAIGYSNTASAIDSASVGISNSANGLGSAAFGYSNISYAESSAAFGVGNRAYGKTSTAFGYQSEAHSEFGSAFGVSNMVFGKSSSAFGYSNKIGISSELITDNSVVLGISCNNNGNDSIVIGKDYTNELADVIVLGGTTQKPIFPNLKDVAALNGDLSRALVVDPFSGVVSSKHYYEVSPIGQTYNFDTVTNGTYIEANPLLVSSDFVVYASATAMQAITSATPKTFCFCIQSDTRMGFNVQPVYKTDGTPDPDLRITLYRLANQTKSAKTYRLFKVIIENLAGTPLTVGSLELQFTRNRLEPIDAVTFDAATGITFP